MKTQKEYNHDYYLKHRIDVIDRLKRRAKVRRDSIRKHKSKPCQDCKKEYPYWVMQFDHVRGEKLGDLNDLMWHVGIKRVLEEIAKCDVVCANCHAERTHSRQVGKWSSDEDAGPSSHAARV